MKITSQKQYLWVREQIRLKEEGLPGGVPDRLPQMKAALSRMRFGDLPYDDVDQGKAADPSITIPASTMTGGNKAARLKF